MDHSNGSFWKICHNENELQKAVELLKEEAFVLGYPAFLGSEDPSNVALLKHLINFSWNLSREVKRHRADKRDMQQNQLHQSQTNEQSQKKLVMLQNKIDVLEKENKKLYNELQNANSCKLAATEESLKVKKNVDELRKVIEFNNNQYNINLEKKILELRSLQNKYENYCKTGKRNTDRKGFENDPNKCNANDKYKNVELVEKAHRKIVSSLEQTVEKLVEENLTLRRFLEKLGRLIFDVNTRISSLKGSQLENEELDILDDLFQLSCEEIKEAIDSYFGSTVQNIVSTFQELLNQLSQQSSNSQ